MATQERLDLIEELWDSLSVDPGKYRSQRLRRRSSTARVAEMDQNDALGILGKRFSPKIRERR